MPSLCLGCPSAVQPLPKKTWTQLETRFLWDVSLSSEGKGVLASGNQGPGGFCKGRELQITCVPM